MFDIFEIEEVMAFKRRKCKDNMIKKYILNTCKARNPETATDFIPFV